MKRGNLLLLLLVVILGVAAAFAASILHNGLSARARPSALETFIARNIRHIAIPTNARAMYPKPPDLRKEHTQKLSDGELFWIIENGVRLTGMPAFGGEAGPDSGEDSWKLVRFIRHLPKLTAEERLEMERYNPKGPEDREEEKEEQDFLNGAPEQPKAETSHLH